VIDGFRPAPARIEGEREGRIAMGTRALRYHLSFLDDILRGISPHDLVLIGAETGAGKTEIATSIAKSNARIGKRVHYIALEAEHGEIERRTKYAVIVKLAMQAQHDRVGELAFADWMMGRCEDVSGPFDAEADRIIAEQYGTLHTFYRGESFGHDDVQRLFKAVRDETDLIVLDHLHYVDLADDESEHRGFARTVKMIRTVALQLGKPVILIAHLRKRDQRAKQIVPHLEDFHGSSELIKNVTHAVMLAPARGIDSKWHDAPTYIYVPKDRRSGTSGLVALCTYDLRWRMYRTTYALGRMVDGGTRFEPLAPQDFPRWAKSARAMEVQS
jgi:replicative DNA helicase